MSSLKFGRAYKFTANKITFSQPLVIELPFTIEFDIERNTYPTTNYGKITIYNLSQYHRDLLLYDQYDYDYFNPITVELQAGYGSGPNWPIIFKGQITKCYSVRQGVDFLTVMECFDGGIAFQNAVTNRTFPAQTAQQDVIAGIIEDLTNNLVPFGISKGAVSKFVGTLAKGESFSGSTIEILRQISNNNFFIDNMQANVLQPGDAIGGPNILINAASGLLGTPIKQQQLLIFSILFEPRIIVGGIVNIQSSTAANIYNGTHQVFGVHHRGTISATVAGEAVTQLTVKSGSFSKITGVGL